MHSLRIHTCLHCIFTILIPDSFTSILPAPTTRLPLNLTSFFCPYTSKLSPVSTDHGV